MTLQILAKRVCPVDVDVPELKRWKPAPVSEDVKKKLENVEPTSVLDLQTSPGRSCSSSSTGSGSLSCQPSLSSDDTSKLELGENHVSVTDENHDIASWMECMEDGLTLSDYQTGSDKLGSDHFVSHADCIDFGSFELGAFDMLADPGLCLIDHFPEGFQLDDSLSSMMNLQAVESSTEVVEAPPLDSGLQLVHLLLACAEAIDESDFDTARPMLNRLKAISNPYGDPMQRIALYFADALSDRLEPTPPGEASSELDKQLAFQSFYEVLPFAKFTYLTANQAIFEAVGYRNNIHVIDLDIQQGLQWPSFLQTLAMRPGGPPHLHLTAVGTNASSLELTKRRLTEFAETLEVPFEFTILLEPLESLDSEKIKKLELATDAALAVNCSHVLHSLDDAERLLTSLRALNPQVVTVLEVEANHNGVNLLSRFVEALHYYCALFDALEGSLTRDSPDRFLIENTTCFAEIRGIVAREGGHAVKSKSWQKVLTKCGFVSKPLSSYAVQQAQLLLAYFVTGDGTPYKLSEDCGALIMGWQDTPVMAVSSWSSC